MPLRMSEKLEQRPERVKKRECFEIDFELSAKSRERGEKEAEEKDYSMAWRLRTSRGEGFLFWVLHFFLLSHKEEKNKIV